VVLIKVYTVPEVAKILRISKNTAYELVYTGKLKAVRIGDKKKNMRITEEALRKFLEKEEEGRTE